MTDHRDHALRNLGDQLDNSQITASARYWQLCEAMERGLHPSADYRMMVGLVGRRIVALQFSVLVREMTRRPGLFTEMVAMLANGMTREIGESLAAFPFEERVRALEGLTAQLAAGLGIGLKEEPAAALPEDPHPTQESTQ
jgi:hypothetical protein